jgi:cytochrome c oxidase subunit 2
MDFFARTEKFVAANKVGERDGHADRRARPGRRGLPRGPHVGLVPDAQAPAGRDVPLHLSSLDLKHGFSLQPLNMNFQVLPGYDHVLTITPTSKGEFTIVCNEFCGIGHDKMIGKIIVD